MRVLVGIGAVVLCLAAAVVPLPLNVVEPGRLIPAAAVAEVTLSKEHVAAAGLEPEPVAGRFLGVHEIPGASLVQVVAAGVSGRRAVVRGRSRPAGPLERPEVVAALLGLGLSPGRLEGTQLPMAVRVGDGLDAASLGVLLHVFDATAAQDLARGRRILGVGVMNPDQTLACPAPAAPALAAAGRDGVDLVVVPSACGVPAGDGAVVAGSFAEAVTALLAE